MKFTPRQLWLDAAIEAPELEQKPVDPASIAAAFNAKLRELVHEVCDMDAERLIAEYTVPQAVVEASDTEIDLTDPDGEEDSDPREWLAIEYIDWLDSDGEGDEVWVYPIEARNRISAEASSGVPTCYITDQLRTLKKVSGWDGVTALTIHGVLSPTEVTEDELETEFDYPAALRAALQWELLLVFARHVGVKDNRLAYWEQRRANAYDRLMGDAAQHIGNRVEGIPRVNRT